MEIKKVTVMLKKVHNFLVWEYGYSGDRGNNGAWALVPRRGERLPRDDLQEEPAASGKSPAPSSFPQGLVGLNPKQLLGTQRVPDTQSFPQLIQKHVPLQDATVMPESARTWGGGWSPDPQEQPLGASLLWF